MTERSIDTIVAVATPEGRGGLAVVRVSGPRAVDIARVLLADDPRLADVQSHRVFLATPRDATSGDALDQVLVLPMLAPATFTGEDVVEFHCHGGPLPARLITDACTSAGARPAGPGEFTRRAFLNGRLSLDQAEAVADLIHAENRLAARGSLKQLRGAFRREIASVESPLMTLLAQLEGGLEFGEEDALDVPSKQITATLDAALDRIDALLCHADAGRQLRDGVQVVLVGEPNAGKSSLFNALLGESRALVDPEPGTTRDVVESRLDHRDVMYVLHDTAGLREDAGRVEAKGVALTRAMVARADLVLQVVDLAAPAGVKEVTDPEGAPVLVVGAKADLHEDVEHMRDRPVDVVTSAKDGRGIETLKDRLHETVVADRLEKTAALGLVLNRRHVHRLRSFRDGLAHLRLTVAGEPDQEVICSLLQASLCELGEITGRVFTEALLGEVFSRFCVGK
jgi:tRNA modification GTPase